MDPNEIEAVLWLLPSKDSLKKLSDLRSSLGLAPGAHDYHLTAALLIGAWKAPETLILSTTLSTTLSAFSCRFNAIAHYDNSVLQGPALMMQDQLPLTFCKFIKSRNAKAIFPSPPHISLAYLDSDKQDFHRSFSEPVELLFDALALVPRPTMGWQAVNDYRKAQIWNF